MMHSTLGQRFSSFDDIPNKDELDIFAMARCGLAYSAAEGERPSMVKCEFCSFVLGNVHARTDCWMEHARHPYCIHFLATVGFVNVPSLFPFNNGGNETVGQFKQNVVENIINQLKCRERNVCTYVTSSGAKFTEPVHIGMVELSERRASLEHMSEEDKRMQNLEHVAEAGLFFDESQLRCYYCDCTVANHCEFRDPWRAHAVVNRNCFHNIISLGEAFTLINVQNAEGSCLSELQGSERGNTPNTVEKRLRMTIRPSGSRMSCRVEGQASNTNNIPNKFPYFGGGAVSLQGQLSRGTQTTPTGIKTCVCGRIGDQSVMWHNLCCHIWICNQCVIVGRCPNCNWCPG